MKKTARLLDSGDYLDYLSGVGATGATVGSLKKNPGGVIVGSPGCQGCRRTFGRHKSSIDVPPFLFNSSLRLFKNYRRQPEYKSVMCPGFYPRAEPTLNAWAFALSTNTPPKAMKNGGERQGSREAKSANYAQDTGLSRKHRTSLVGELVAGGGYDWRKYVQSIGFIQWYRRFQSRT